MAVDDLDPSVKGGEVHRSLSAPPPRCSNQDFVASAMAAVPDGGAAELVDPIEKDPDPLLERDTRGPIERPPNLRGIREGAVGLAWALRDTNDIVSPDEFDEAIHALRPAQPDVEDLARDAGLGGPDEGIGHIGHIRKVPRLRPVPDDGERSPGELLREKDAEDRAVRPRGARPRAVDVEEAERDAREPVTCPSGGPSVPQVFREGVGYIGRIRPSLGVGKTRDP